VAEDGVVEPNYIVVGFAGEGAQGGWPKIDFVDQGERERERERGVVEPNCIVVCFAGEGAQGGWPKMDFVDGFMLKLKRSSSWLLKGHLFSG
jgi:hypothetical protein